MPRNTLEHYVDEFLRKTGAVDDPKVLLDNMTNYSSFSDVGRAKLRLFVNGLSADEVGKALSAAGALKDQLEAEMAAEDFLNGGAAGMRAFLRAYLMQGVLERIAPKR